VTAERVTGVVLAAGRSRRLGRPKQLLPYAGTTLLGATLDAARRCPFDQLILTLGAVQDEVREVRAAVALDGVQVVLADDAGSGCSVSLRAALAHVDGEAAGIVLLLGDQPGVEPRTVERLIAERAGGAVAVCHYADGVGHPFWLGRAVFGELSLLHGDKGVWKVVERAGSLGTLTEVSVDGDIPLDVDTWADYERLLDSAAPR
jgi:molybdenum cofactor cytidylyltransferase